MSFEQAYFDANYRSYEAQNPPGKLAFYRRVIERWAPPGAAGGRLALLDVGCGLGRFVASLPAERFDRHGTDVSEWALAEDRERYPGIDFRRASATDRPYPPDSFDVVTAMDVVEHVPGLEAVGEAVTSMLRPGGLFVFVVPVYDGLSGPIIRRLDRDPTHVHKRQRSFWLDWAKGRFELLEWTGILRYLLPGGFYLHLPMRWARRHTPAILVAAKKPAAAAGA